MSSVDLSGKPWQALEPHPGNHSPTMLKPDERRYLQWLTQERYTGAGAIVDAGPLLGGSTVPLAEGLRRNPRLHESRKIGRIHSYDLFEYESYMSGLFAPGESLPAQGGSLLPRFLAHTEPWRPFIEVYPGDIEQFSWDGGPIEILFIDLAKSWQLQAHLLRQFFPHLIPGVSVVVQQDYFFYGCPWIHIVMEQLADHLTPAHLPDAPSLGFTFDKAIPTHLLESDHERELSARDKRRLMERAGDRFTGPKRLVAMTAQAFLQLSENDIDGAVEVLEAVRRSPDADHTVVYDFDQVAQLVTERLADDRQSSQRVVRGLFVQTDRRIDFVSIDGLVRTAASHAVESIREAASAGRPIYVWGAGQGGRNAAGLLRRHEVEVTGFVDRDRAKHGTTVDALPVHPPDRLELWIQPRPYLAISGKFASEIADGLRAGGWQPQADYIVW